MNPVGSGRVVFPDELMESAVGLYPFEPLASCVEVGEVDVGGLAEHVLACGGAAYGFVEFGAAIARADGDGMAVVFAEGLEDVLCEDCEADDDAVGGRVVDASRPRRC